MFSPALAAFLNAPSDNISIRAVFFDDAESVLLKGESVRGTLRALIDSSKNRAYQLKVTQTIRVQVTSKTLPEISPVGVTNPNPVTFATPEQIKKSQKRQGPPTSALVLAQAAPTGECTLGVHVQNISSQPLDSIAVALVVPRPGEGQRQLNCYSPNSEAETYCPDRYNRLCSLSENFTDLKDPAIAIASHR